MGKVKDFDLKRNMDPSLSAEKPGEAKPVDAKKP
jgi:hypothetical protein